MQLPLHYYKSIITIYNQLFSEKDKNIYSDLFYFTVYLILMESIAYLRSIDSFVL
jgi:hypothetical protein